MKENFDIESLEDHKLYSVPIGLLKPDPDQPRKHFESESINGLAKSIEKNSVLQPIHFTRLNSKELRIISGERRWQASKIAGLKFIPGIYLAKPSKIVALIENMAREDLNPLERAEAIQRLISKHKYKQEEIAEQLGMSRSNISNVLSLIKLSDEIKNECRESKDYSLRELLKIARKATEEDMTDAFNKLKEKMSTGKNTNKLDKVTVDKNQIQEKNTRKMIQMSKQITEIMKSWTGDLSTKDVRNLRLLSKELQKLLDDLDKANQ